MARDLIDALLLAQSVWEITEAESTDEAEAERHRDALLASLRESLARIGAVVEAAIEHDAFVRVYDTYLRSDELRVALDALTAEDRRLLGMED